MFSVPPVVEVLEPPFNSPLQERVANQRIAFPCPAKGKKKNFLPVSCYYKEPLWRTICELLLNDVFTVVKHTEINSNLKLAQRAHTVSQPSLGSFF